MPSVMLFRPRRPDSATFFTSKFCYKHSSLFLFGDGVGILFAEC